MRASFSHLVAASLTLSWSEVISSNAKYYLIANNQAYILLGSLFNISRSFRFTFLAANTFLVVAIVLGPPCAIADLVAAIVFCTITVVELHILFNYAFWEFTVIARGYANYYTNYAIFTLEVAINYSANIFIYSFYHKANLLHYSNQTYRTLLLIFDKSYSNGIILTEKQNILSSKI